jgi:XTP/dITP diphosphohydrolase
MKFLICTNNKSKLAELKRILESLNIEAYSPKELGIDLGDVVEDGKTFMENAFIKAKSGMEKSGLNAIADDSGLCVDALFGRPGVYTARYGGEDLPYPQKCQMLMDELKDVKDENRGAEFKCVIAVLMTDGKKIEVEGKCRGKIGYKMTGENGFGYDPIFMVGDKSFAEISDDEKDKISHRGNALRLMKEKLKEYLEENK